MRLFHSSRENGKLGKNPPQFMPKGTSFIKNFDTIAQGIDPGDTVDLIPEPSNPYDPNAVRLIHKKTGEFIGHLPKEHCVEYLQELEDGNQWVGIVDVIFDKDNNRKSAGMRLILEEKTAVPGVPDRSIEDRVLSLDSKYVDKLADILDNTNNYYPSDSYDIAVDFFIFAREHFGFPYTEDIEDPLSSARIYGTGRLLLKSGVDIENYNNKRIAESAARIMDGFDGSAYEYDIQISLIPFLPTGIIVHIAEVDDERDEILVSFDRDDSEVELWRKGEPDSTMIARFIHYVVSAHAQQLDIDNILFL